MKYGKFGKPFAILANVVSILGVIFTKKILKRKILVYLSKRKDIPGPSQSGER
jgi:hypothetical protein